MFSEADDPLARAGQAVVVTSVGDVLAAGDATLAAGRLRLVSPLLGPAEVPVASAKVIYLPSSAQAAADLEKRYRRMKLPRSASDRLVVMRPSQEPLVVEGVLEGMDGENVTVRWKGQLRRIGRSRVRMIRLAAVASETRRPAGTLVGSDGSQVSFQSVTLEKGSLACVSLSAGKKAVALGKVAGIRFALENVTKLSELKPAAVKQHGFFETTFPYRVDRSVSGKRLRLGGRTWRSGLGLHSFCELTYRLDGAYSLFVATVGIDDAVRPHGDATVTFLAGGKPLGKGVRVTGTSDPQAVRLRLDAAKTFTVRVDFGADGLGFADHVDLAEPRLIR